MQPQSLTTESYALGTAIPSEFAHVAEQIAGCRLQMEIDTQVLVFARWLHRIAPLLTVRDYVQLRRRYEDVWHEVLEDL